MDLESECFAVEVVEQNGATQGTVDHHVDDNEIKDNHHLDDCKSEDNGSCTNDTQVQRLSTNQRVDSDALTANNHATVVAEIVQPMHSPSLSYKGYGLKKWRRIKRDFVKDSSSSSDSSKMLKRGLSGSANPAKPQHFSLPEFQPNTEASVGPLTMFKSTTVAPHPMIPSPTSDSRFAVGAAFAAATESENSEDRSSKSSTAGSMPKFRFDLPAVLGFIQDKSQKKNLTGKSVGFSSQRVQEGKGCVESTKKPRGERVKIEKENSYSSMESDSRSSNFVFITSNGKQCGKFTNHDGENSNEAHDGRDQSNQAVKNSYRTENSGEIEELSADDLAEEEKSENHQLSPDQDPLVESILGLQSVHEALENEVQKLGDIGKEFASLHDCLVNINSGHMDSTFVDQEIRGTSSSHQVASPKMSNGTSGSLETQVFTLTQKVIYLESKLEEARDILQAKEARICELENNVNSNRSPKEESGSTAELQQDRYREVDFELEGLFLQKMEAEIEFLALTRAVQKLRVSLDNQITVYEEQTSLAEMLNKLGEAESKAAKIKKQAGELEKCCDVLSSTEEVLKMQRRACKVLSCFFMQLVLLVLVFSFVILKFSAHSGMVVPT